MTFCQGTFTGALLFRITNHSYTTAMRPSSLVGSSLLSSGLLALLFGIMILIQPDLIAYIVATFFIVIGLSLIGTWWKLRP